MGDTLSFPSVNPMGRAEASQGLAPQATRKDARAKQARQIINKTIPALLASNQRARQGVQSSTLIVKPEPVGLESKANLLHDVNKSSPQDGSESSSAQYLKRKGQGRRKMKHDRQMSQDSDYDGTLANAAGRVHDLPLASTSQPPPRPLQIRIINSDTLTVAAMLGKKTNNKKTANVCVLNMASPLRPGGGVLAGATSQEEFLCARTTLLPSLKESFYRLPDVGGILTRDVLVFRSAAPLGDSIGELRSDERFWVDVISAAALRFPELEGDADTVKHLSKKDQLQAEDKMRAVLRIAVRCKAKRLVLGAWGCGAYGNPALDIANIWQKVLVGDPSGAREFEPWNGIGEVVFAITNVKMADVFSDVFNVPVDVMPGANIAGKDNDDDDNDDKERSEILEKIEALERQFDTARFPDLKARLGTILNELKAELDAHEPSRVHRSAITDE